MGAYRSRDCFGRNDRVHDLQVLGRKTYLIGDGLAGRSINEYQQPDHHHSGGHSRNSRIGPSRGYTGALGRVRCLTAVEVAV